MGGGKESGGAEAGADKPSLKLQALSEFDKISAKKTEVTVMAKVTAVSQDNEERRAPVTICAAIDRSGSMKDHLPLLKDTLLFVVQQLTANDKLCLVTFDHQVQVELPLTKMDANGKESAEKAIRKVKERGHTNLSGGLLAGLETLYRVPSEEATLVESILLFTDGKANVGIQDKERVAKATSSMLAQIGRQACVFTFGYGAEHESEFLQAVATAGNGLYYYIDDADSIPQSFCDCLGGLLSVAAQNVRVTITAAENISLSTPLTTFKVDQKERGKCYEVTIPDVYCEEEKCLLITATANADINATEPLTLPILSCTVQFFDVLNSKQTEEVADCSVVRNKDCVHPVSSDFAEDIELHKMRCLVANTLEDANKMATAGRFDVAKEVLCGTRARIQGSIVVSKPLAVHLLETLNESLLGIQDRVTYLEHGQSAITNYTVSHWQQRSNLKPSYEKYRIKKSPVVAAAAAASPASISEDEFVTPYTITSKKAMLKKHKK